MKKLNCKNCTERKFGCHSTCQAYVVNRVINMYKQEKKSEEYDLQRYNPVLVGRIKQKLRNELNGHAQEEWT